MQFQAACDFYGVDLDELKKEIPEMETTDSEMAEMREQDDSIDQIKITSVSGGLNEDLIEAGMVDTIHSQKLTVIEPKELVQVSSSSGDMYVEKSEVSLLQDYEQHVEILPRGGSLKYKCKFCGKVFFGPGSQGELSGQVRIMNHIIAHLNRLKKRKAGPNILKRRTAQQVIPNQPQVNPVVLAPVAILTPEVQSIAHRVEEDLTSYMNYIEKNNNNTVTCRLCGNTYLENSVNAIKGHMQGIHFKEDRVHKLAGHMQYIEKNTNSRYTVKCKLCNIQLPNSVNKKAVKSHLQTIHCIDVEETAPTVPNMWQCKFCSEMFTPGSIQAMEQHLLQQHAEALEPDSPLLKTQTETSQAPQMQISEQVTPSVSQVATVTQLVQSDTSPDLSTYNMDTVKCKFCGEMFVKASLVDLQKHLLSQHQNVIDPNTMAEIRTTNAVDESPPITIPSATVQPTVSETQMLNERVAAAVSQTIQEQVLISHSGSVIPQSHITLSVGNQSVNLPCTSSSPQTNVQFTSIEPNTSHGEESVLHSVPSIHPKVMKVLITRLQAYVPFVEIVRDKFGPGYKCRLCGKTYSSSALSPIRRHLVQFHASSGHSYQGLEIPTGVKPETVCVIKFIRLVSDSEYDSNARMSELCPQHILKHEIFGSFGLSTKEPCTIMFCPSSSLVSSCIGIGIVCAHLPLAHG